MIPRPMPSSIAVRPRAIARWSLTAKAPIAARLTHRRFWFDGRAALQEVHPALFLLIALAARVPPQLCRSRARLQCRGRQNHQIVMIFSRGGQAGGNRSSCCPVTGRSVCHQRVPQLTLNAVSVDGVCQ